MKAFLLAAGLGSRLRPLTNTVPKCMVSINGRPLLSYWMDLLDLHGFDDVLVNLHHLPAMVRAYVESIARPRVTLFHETELLGSAGTVRANRQWIETEEPFLVAYADNLTDVNLSSLVAAHLRRKPLLTMGLFRTTAASQCGIAELEGDEDSAAILTFEEKPAKPKSNWANAGLYVTDRKIVDRIPEGVADFGHDVLPDLVGEMRGHALMGRLMDVGTWENYNRAQIFALSLKPQTSHGTLKREIN